MEAGSSLEGYLQPGDRLYRIDGERVYIANDFTTLLSLDLARDGNFHDVVVIRDGKQVTFPRLNVEARQLPSGDGMSLRYGINLVTEPRSLGNVLSYSAKSAVNYARTVRLSLQMIFRGELGLKEVPALWALLRLLQMWEPSPGVCRWESGMCYPWVRSSPSTWGL